jgi:hypothetical protein
MQTYSNGYHFGMVNLKPYNIYSLYGWYVDGVGERRDVSTNGRSIESCVARLMLTEHELCMGDAQFFGGYLKADCDVTSRVRECSAMSIL